MMKMMVMVMTVTMMMVPGLDVLAMVHEQPQPPRQLGALPPGQQRQPQRDDRGVHGRVLRVGGQAGAEVRGTPGQGGIFSPIIIYYPHLASTGHSSAACCSLSIQPASQTGQPHLSHTAPPTRHALHV